MPQNMMTYQKTGVYLTKHFWVHVHTVYDLYLTQKNRTYTVSCHVLQFLIVSTFSDTHMLSDGHHSQLF